MTTTTPLHIPRPGMLATVRNRRGIVSAVEPFDGEHGRVHLVHLEYKDDQFPREEQLLWDLEPRKNLLEPTALPDIAGDPLIPEDFDAILRAARWTATSPYLDPDAEGPVERLPISAPFHGAIQMEDYQLVPLLKALRMPRVNLLIADDVGLGKTVEAGLILSELLLRRRIQRILILTPASLRLQWRDAMWQQFSIPFDLVDRAETHDLRKRLGMDANPWRSFSRIIASYHYLRQEDVLEQFRAACHTQEGTPFLPWDLLIVDEVHNLMPSALGEDSDLCRMLRIIAPQFEHRIFLSATPHNGHTRSFTGLLEILDPVRFSQTSELKPAEKERIQQVVLRRLKREINARTSSPRFCTRRPPLALQLKLSREEAALSGAFDKFRVKVRSLIATGEGKRRRAGSFAIEILGKRLLSCPIAFAESWRRCKEGLALAEAVGENDVAAAERSLRQETGDDRETQSRESLASHIVGAWLKTISPGLRSEIDALDHAVATLGLQFNGEPTTSQQPDSDSRFDALHSLIQNLLRTGGRWRDDERLIVFTEYKTTLDYLTRRLRTLYEPDRILTLYGSGGKEGMDEQERNRIKEAFNNPDDRVRVLVATDAAAEGLDLQNTARYLLHFDCPWNPSRLEQRNGRLDRYGQARDVTVHHFVSDQDDDLRFLSHVIHKADEIREDLGSTNELFGEAAQRRFVDGEGLATVQANLDQRLIAARGRVAIAADDSVGTASPGKEAATSLKAVAAELDLDPQTLRHTLEAAMAIRAGRPQLECSKDKKTCKILHPDLPGWAEIIDDSLRQEGKSTARGALPLVAFSPEPFVKDVGGRSIFSPRKDVRFLHLSHPMYQKALGLLTRRRFPGTEETASRWSVRLGDVPRDASALLLLSLEELAVNDLRESFHHWVQTIVFPIRNRSLGAPLAHTPANLLRSGNSPIEAAIRNRGREILEDLEPDLKTVIQGHSVRLAQQLNQQLKTDGVQARKQEDERYRSRQGEVSALIAENTIARLEREIQELKKERDQGFLFEEANRLGELDRQIEEKKAEIFRRTHHYEEVRAQLEKERRRILDLVLPKRFKLAGDVQVFPVCIEVRLPGGGK